MSHHLKHALALAALGCGCARAHLTEKYGESYAAVFSEQAPPRPKTVGPVSGLDSQEAAIISGSYRKSIAPKDTQVKDQPVLIVAPPTQQGGYGMTTLAPSVPKG
jgi:hypothetical protein